MEYMVYKSPGAESIHGVMVDTRIVQDVELDEALADGWHYTPTEAHQASPKKDEKPAAPKDKVK
jgi:hypothetical protein